MYDDMDFYPEDIEEEPLPPEEEPDPFMPTPEDMMRPDVMRPQTEPYDPNDVQPQVPLPTDQVAGLTPPYGTRREPSVNSVAQDPRDINQFIRESLRQGEYRDMPPEARDVHEQIDMIRGAAPRMPPQDIQRFLEEQMRGQGYMLPPRPEDAIPPEYEEEVFRGRRFG